MKIVVEGPDIKVTFPDFMDVVVRRADYDDVLEAVMEGGWTDADGRPTLKDAARVIREANNFREEVWNEDAIRDGTATPVGPPEDHPVAEDVPPPEEP